MTTTEPAALPEWEARLHRTGFLPHVEDDWARDPDYLITRLRQAMERATAAANEFRDEDEYHPRRIADTIELNALRRRIGDLVEELRPHTRAADEMLAALRGSCPDIEWLRYKSGFLGIRNYDFHRVTPDDAVARCATQLGLPAERIEANARQWGGVLEGWHIYLVGS